MWAVVLLLLSCLSLQALAASSSTYECGACSLLVSEIESSIAAVDPNKKISAGSFRVNPKGEQQGIKKVAYARSHTHIVELLEGVCTKATDYKRVVNPLTGKAVFVNKKATYLKGDENKTMLSKLQNACNELVDEYEEKIEKFFQTEREDSLREFCFTDLKVCTSVDLAALPPDDPPAQEETTTEDPLSDEL